MWNSSKKLISQAVCLILIALLRQSPATEFRITALTPNSAHIKFTLSTNKSKPSETTQSFTFAVPSNPSNDITVAITSQLGVSFSNYNITSLSRGWMGKHYLQWFSITLQLVNKKVTGDTGIDGTILLSYSQPILRADPTFNDNITHGCIIKLPLHRTFSKRAVVNKPNIPYTHGIRMNIPQDGIYKITGNNLSAIGLPIANISSKTYRLFCKNIEIPLYFSENNNDYLGKDDYFLFYGKSLRGEKNYYTQYTNENTYWLTWDNKAIGARVAEAVGWYNLDPFSYNPFGDTPPLIAREFTDTLHIEMEIGILWQGDISNVEQIGDLPAEGNDVDNWYWGSIGKNKLTDFTFSVPSPKSANVQNTSMKVYLTGLTSLSNNSKDHQYSIQINKSSINSPNAIWDGQKDYLFTSKLFEGNKLYHGTNTITFSRLQDDNVPDRGALNWIEIIYLKGFKSLNDKIYFRNNAENINRWTQFNLTDFSSNDLELWDIGKFRKFNQFKVENISGKYTLSFQDSITGFTRFFAQTKNLRITPTDMTFDTITDEWDFTDGVDYIIISTEELIPILQPLIDVHINSGLKVKTIDIQDIYNRFSYGLPDPESIRSMLKYVFSKHPNDPPQYLLLGGDGNHDLNKGSPEKNVIPVHLTRVPNWGPASDDGYFATIHGDDNFPDLLIGRFPARNKEDMKILVDKTVNYLLYPEHGYWRDNIILAGGVEPEFTTYNNEAVTNIIGPRMNILRMDADPSSPYYTSSISASNKMAGFINAGTYAINFIGHGGGNTWSDSRFFSFSDLPKLHNSQWGKSGRLPIVFSFTCLTGFFESNFYESLGEEFLRKSQNGCIAFYGASAYTKRNIDIHMSRTLLNTAMENSAHSLGELINITEMLMLVNNTSEALPLIRQYNLLGDPALPWKLTPQNLTVTLEDQNLKETDTLKISGNTSPIATGNIKLSVVADNRATWGEIIKTINDSSYNHNFVLKNSAQTAKGIVRAFAWNDSMELMGWKDFSKDTFAVQDVVITPAQPAIGDSVTVTCRIDSRDSLYIPIIQCRYTIVNPLEHDIIFDDSSFVFMRQDTLLKLWVSDNSFPLRQPGTPFDINQKLVLKFFATGNLGTSDFYFFDLMGRPDLTFTSDTIEILWKNDSLNITCEVLNIGNSHSPPFSIIFESRDATGIPDTIVQVNSLVSLNPGKIKQFSFSLPDTNKLVNYVGTINPGQAIEEIDYSNNETSLSVSLMYADLYTPADTLEAFGKGCCLVPADTLSKTYRAFIFYDTLTDKQPLMSRSEWVSLKGDKPFKSFYMYTRPALSAQDSLIWIFYPEQSISFLTDTSDSGYHAGIFVYDSVSSQWQNRGGNANAFYNTFYLSKKAPGKHALGRLSDNVPPNIQIFVGGKEILYLDYAAKNKPFNIILTDSSGIDSSSIQLLLNNSPLDKNYNSSLIASEHPSTVILTTYPQKANDIDSLTVIAEDNAGNVAKKNFAYKPGENLNIRFFTCHPNPFTAKPGKFVRFAFLITDVADKVTLTIYTISGRKVWQTSNTSSVIGYQEIRWDGTTQNRRHDNLGYRIANGTYYAKLVVANSEKKVKKIIRIAKLEGY